MQQKSQLTSYEFLLKFYGNLNLSRTWILCSTISYAEYTVSLQLAPLSRAVTTSRASRAIKSVKSGRSRAVVKSVKSTERSRAQRVSEYHGLPIEHLQSGAYVLYVLYIELMYIKQNEVHQWRLCLNRSVLPTIIAIITSSPPDFQETPLPGCKVGGDKCFLCCKNT